MKTTAKGEKGLMDFLLEAKNRDGDNGMGLGSFTIVLNINLSGVYRVEGCSFWYSDVQYCSA